nr:hypothetical protein [Natrinema caseinilyticum]
MIVAILRTRKFLSFGFEEAETVLVDVATEPVPVFADDAFTLESEFLEYSIRGVVIADCSCPDLVQTQFVEGVRETEIRRFRRVCVALFVGGDPVPRLRLATLQVDVFERRTPDRCALSTSEKQMTVVGFQFSRDVLRRDGCSIPLVAAVSNRRIVESANDTFVVR